MDKMENVDEHLAPLPRLTNRLNESESDFDEDSCVEIASSFDETEIELIKWTDYLQINSSSDDDHNDDRDPISPTTLVPYSSSDESSENEDSTEQLQRLNNFTNLNSSINDLPSTSKRKRRQWSVAEKLHAIAHFEKTNNKHQTAKYIMCATKQLRSWINNKQSLIELSSRTKGRKRKRLDGGGKKMVFIELDSQLFEWYRERRTAPGDTTSDSVIRREKVTFRRLERQGRKISAELNHPCPSSKWFGRFLVRHRLSLQRPKRQQKMPLEEVYQKATSFYSFLRRASHLAPKRGPMGAFTPRDVFNMDESPLSLFGDQSKRSINDIGTCNEVEGCLSNKRFCTIILTVSGDDQRINPVLIFKGTGRVAPNEEKEYAKGIKVYFTPKAFNNKQTMDKSSDWFTSKVRDGNAKLLIIDSVRTHLHPETIQILRRKGAIVAVVPGGCTMYLQVLDVSVFSTFKKHYNDAAEEYLDANGPRNQVKLTASSSRILCTRLTMVAWQRTIKSVDFGAEFKNIGYIWIDDSPVVPRTLSGYSFDPTSVIRSPIQQNEVIDENQSEIPITEAHSHAKKTSIRPNTQATLDQFWKK